MNQEVKDTALELYAKVVKEFNVGSPIALGLRNWLTQNTATVGGDIVERMNFINSNRGSLPVAGQSEAPATTTGRFQRFDGNAVRARLGKPEASEQVPTTPKKDRFRRMGQTAAKAQPTADGKLKEAAAPLQNPTPPEAGEGTGLPTVPGDENAAPVVAEKPTEQAAAKILPFTKAEVGDLAENTAATAAKKYGRERLMLYATTHRITFSKNPSDVQLAAQVITHAKKGGE